MADISPDRLRGHRHGAGLTLAEVAAHIGRSSAALKTYEAGTSRPPAPVAAALAELYGLTGVNDLYSARDDPIRDYATALAAHCRPLTAAELEGATVVLGRLRRRRAALAQPDPAGTFGRAG